MGTTSAPCVVASAVMRACKSAGFPAARTSAVPMGYVRPPSVNGPPTLCTRSPCRTASAVSAAAAEPHGTRYPTLPAATERGAGGAV